MDNYQLVVGNEDCPIRAVVKIVLNSASIRNDWPKFAIQLDVSSEKIKSFRQGLLLNIITSEEIIYEVLVIWKAENGSKATLATLLQVVEGHCGANDVGELLRLEYKLPCKRKRSDSDNSIGWEDLPPAFQKRVTETFQLFTPNLKHAEVLPKLTGSALDCLMRGRKPHVLSLPEELSYYVSRTVVTRNIISAQIFDQNSSDIFLFTGMDRYELSKLAKNKLTGGSRQLLQGSLYVKFMILDQENHFERICGKTTQPVHLLRKETDGKMMWRKSNGGMDNLRGYIDKKQDDLDEGQFCQISASKTIPVLICDTPGMGKSVLLAQIGHSLIQTHPERTVLFIVLSKFIDFAKALKIEDKFKVIEQTLQNWTGFALQQSKLDSDVVTVSIELLFDGYDEVDSADRKLALEILQTIRKSFKSIRLWITSRPHLMHELENSLNVLGYNIRPFHEENQIHFLSSFWARRVKLDQEKVQQFAKKCLKSLKATMNSTEDDIAGIPLQCLLIGEVYEDDALEYAKMDKEVGSCPTIEIEIGTITNLYHQLIKKKFEKYSSVFRMAKWSVDDLMTIHAHLSLEELFPVEHGILKLTKAAEIDIDEVVKGGILISTRMGEITFLHRTFAEYFVGWFIVDKLQQEEEWTPELLNLFFTILRCSKNYKNVTKFTHPVICYFLNSMLANIQLEHLPNNFPSKFNDNQLELVTDIALACVEGNFVQIFKLFDTRRTYDILPSYLSNLDLLVVFDKLPSMVFNLDLLFLGVRDSCLELVKLVLAGYERHRNFDLEVQKATLREAVKQGKFSIVEFLIKEKQLGGIVENFDEDTNLVRDCVKDTSDCSEEQINERIQVLQMLVGIKRSQVDGLNGSSTPVPLLSNMVHVKLFIELVRLGANILFQTGDGETVLHLFYYATPEYYHNLVVSCPRENLEKIINLAEADHHDTALLSMMRSLDPLTETLDIFHGVGADFNQVDKDGNSVLEIAIEEGRNAETIRKLIQLGAKRLNRTTNLLHVAAKFGNVAVLEVLLDECKIQVNSMDDNGWTPLDHAIDKLLYHCPSSCFDERERFPKLAKILTERGGRTKKSFKFLEESLLHLVLTNDLESVKLLVQLGIYQVTECERSSLSLGDRYSIIRHLLQNGSDPTALNTQNETPFHAFLNNKKGRDFKIFHLLKSKWDERSLWTPTIATLALGYAIWDDAFSDQDFEFLARECEAHGGADFNWRGGDNLTLLHIAARNGKASSVKFLCEKGIDVNSKDNIFGESPLHMAASSNQNTCLEIIMYLMEKGANPMEKNNWRANILHYAAAGAVEGLKYFLELGRGWSDVNGKDILGETPLHYAVNKRNQWAKMDGLEKCKLLIQHGADVNMKNRVRQNPMETAMVFQRENIPLIELLRLEMASSMNP